MLDVAVEQEAKGLFRATDVESGDDLAIEITRCEWTGEWVAFCEETDSNIGRGKTPEDVAFEVLWERVCGNN